MAGTDSDVQSEQLSPAASDAGATLQQLTLDDMQPSPTDVDEVR